MKNFFLIGILSVFLFGCQELVCDAPYILDGDNCCLDDDGNQICDILELPKVDEKPIEKIDDPENNIDSNIEIQQPIEVVSYDLELQPLKDNIRLIDQAVFMLIVKNKADKTQTYNIEKVSTGWIMSTSPQVYPTRISVRGKSENYIRVILQPDKNKIMPGDQIVKLRVYTEKEEKTIDLNIKIK